MFDQAQVYHLFGEIDRLPGIIEPRVGRWRAWPMAKMQLVWHLMHAPSGSSGGGDAGSVLRKAARRLPSYVAAWPHLWHRPNGEVPRGPIGMLYAPRMHRLRDGRARDFIFGELLAGAALQHPVIALRHQLGADAASAISESIDLAPYHLLAEQLALVLIADPRLRRAAAALNGLLDGTAIPLSQRARRRKILLALALFEARRRIFRRLFARLGLGALVCSYAPG